MTNNPTMHRLSILADGAGMVAVRIIFQEMTDADLVAAWQCSGGEAGDPIADLLAAEMERREVVL